MLTFEDRYVPEPNSGCWLWEGNINRDGYGRLRHHGQDYLAHRFSWAVYRGKVPDEVCVLHKCDTPCCVNPEHLFLGSQADNMHDMTRKKRGRPQKHLGDDNGNSKLMTADILAIRKDQRIYRKIALDYGVNLQTIYRIKTRQCWVHVK